MIYKVIELNHLQSTCACTYFAQQKTDLFLKIAFFSILIIICYYWSPDIGINKK